jgi:hypothetical protein
LQPTSKELSAVAGGKDRMRFYFYQAFSNPFNNQLSTLQAIDALIVIKANHKAP